MKSEGAVVDRELVHRRSFSARRELVWQAFTQREHIGRWWGPNGFATTTHEMQVAPGGKWRFVMHGPDGVDYPNEITYEVVDPPERLIYRQGGGKEDSPVQFRVTVSLIARGGETEVVMRLVFPTVELRETAVRVYGAVEGGRQTLERLASHLVEIQEAAQ